MHPRTMVDLLHVIIILVLMMVITAEWHSLVLLTNLIDPFPQIMLFILNNPPFIVPISKKRLVFRFSLHCKRLCL